MISAIEKSLTRTFLARFWPSERKNLRELVQTGWIVGDQAAVSLASFASTVIVGRMCGQEELGIYVLATTMFWLLAGIPNALTWTPFTSRAPRMPADRRAAYTGSVTIHTVVVTLILAAMFGTAGLLPPAWFGQRMWFSTMCLALVPFTVMMTLREHVRRLCLSQVATREILLLDFPIAIAQIGLLLWLARSRQLTANTGLIAIAAACLLSVVWLVVRRSDFQFCRRRTAIHWSYNLQFGRWLLAVSIAWLLADSMYRWIVGWQYGLEGLGRFASAQAVVLFINPLLLTATNFGRALSANRLANGGMSDLRRFTLQATVLVTIVGGLAFLALAIVGGPLVRILFGEHFSGLGGIVATLCLGMLVRVAGVPIDASLAAMREGRTMFIAIIAQLAVVVLAGVPLVAQFGLGGVGYTMALAYGAAAAIQWRRFLQCDPSIAGPENAEAPALGFN
jgi:O-antigen/teichoic acid export membrane protein